jgi:hypothetical protein
MASATRAAPWVEKCPEAVTTALDALQTTKVLLVAQPGATMFTLCEMPASEASHASGGRQKRVAVSLGAHHACSACFPNKPAPRVCRHLVFVLHKVLRIPADNPLLWQLSLSDAQIDQVLNARRLYVGDAERKRADLAALPRPKTPEPMPLGATCPICQDVMTPDDAVACCGVCSQYAHNRCMRVWAEHRQASGDKVTCPLCRADWGEDATASAFRARSRSHARTHPHVVHRRVRCSHCKVGPISGTRYRCLQCPCGGVSRRGVDLCSRCFHSGAHPGHVFVQRESVTTLPRTPKAYEDPSGLTAGDSLTLWGGWGPSERHPDSPDSQVAALGLSNQGDDPTDRLQALERRELLPSDYELLLSLDRRRPTLLEHMCSALLPVVDSDTSKCMLCGGRCVCLSSVAAGVLARSQGRCCAPADPAHVSRKLPCGHTVHEACLREELASRNMVCGACKTRGPTMVAFPGLVDWSAKSKPKEQAASASSSSAASSPSTLGDVSSTLKIEPSSVGLLRIRPASLAAAAQPMGRPPASRPRRTVHLGRSTAPSPDTLPPLAIHASTCLASRGRLQVEPPIEGGLPAIAKGKPPRKTSQRSKSAARARSAPRVSFDPSFVVSVSPLTPAT